MGMYSGGSRNITDDPEQKDASLFPESRVRPWVVDNDTERLVEDSLDTLEKALTCLSPVKDGLGSGPLDHVHRDDQGVDMFLKNMADLKAEERARESSSPGGGDQLAPIGEMLEKFYRETMEASVESTSEPAFSEPVDNEEDVLMNDPDVARLLAEMRGNFSGECNTGPESETGEGGETGGKDVNGVRQEDKVNAVGQENSPREDEATNAARRQRHHDENGLQQAGSSCGIDGNGWRKIGHCRERGDQNDGGTAHLGHSEISTATGASSATQSQQGSIDISRIKIDGLGGVGRSKHRSRSVPSICLSAGGCSRLSRTSTMSSHTLARAASQKILEATKEAAEQASTDRKNGAVETPHRAASSAIAKADERINVVRQNAEALQAKMSLKRTSYLKSRRPRAVGWRRHETNFPRVRPYSSRRRKEGTPRSRTTATDGHQSQLSMAAVKRRGLPRRFKGSLSTPLLSDAEAAFVFGTKEDEVPTEKSPSLRQTTLGRMLRRAALLSSVASSSPRSDASEHSSLYGHRPSTADKTRGARSRGGGNRREASLDNALRVNSGLAGPPSAATEGQKAFSTRRTRSSATAATHRRKRGPHAESSRHGTPILISPFSERETSTASNNMSPKDRFCGGQGADSPRRTDRKRLPRSVHKALEAALLAASVDTAVSPQEQFVSARKIIADMKRLNTRDSVGDLLDAPALRKQGESESSLTTECWSTETGHRYR